jgi:AhpC/TSA family/Thiol:disulfide interchange protein DsbD, N-terminal
LEEKYPAIRQAGLGLAAISYDSRDVLRNFSDRQHIQFPLVSDPNSAIIRKFGILNEQVKKDSPNYGIPYPGIYLVDANGVIKAKFFENDYRERDTAGMILLQQFGINPDTESAPISAKHMQFSIAATDPNPRAGQHLSLTLTFKLAPDVHVYAPGVHGYISIDWDLPDTPALKAGPVTYPQSKLLRLEVIHETVPVYEGEVQLVRTITLSDQKQVAPLLDPSGDLKVNGSFRYQACDQTRCFIPETVPVTLTLHVRALDRTRVPENMRRKAN